MKRSKFLNVFKGSSKKDDHKKHNNFQLHKKFFQLLLSPYIIIAFFLIVVPFLITCFYSMLTANETGNISFTVNLKNFVEFFSNASFIRSLFLSILYALIAAIICLIIGYPFAYFLAFSKSKILKNNIFLLISMPLWISLLLRSIGLQNMINLVNPNLLGTAFSVILGMVYLFLPFMILPIYNSLEKIDESLIEAGKDLGASSIRVFWTIIFRFSLPGLFSGIALVIVQASTSLVIVKYMGVGKINLISKVIESYFFQGANFYFGAALSVLLIIFISLVIGATKLIEKLINGKVQPNEEFY